MGGWDLLIGLFVIAMLLSIVHGVRLWRRTRRTGPEYWAARFEQACQRRDPRQAAQALLMWSRMRWPGGAPANLTGLARALDHPDASWVLERLGQAVTGGQGKLWDSKGCCEVMLPLIQGWHPVGENTPDDPPAGAGRQGSPPL